MSRNVFEMFEILTSARNPTDASIEASLRQLQDDVVIRGLLNMNFNPRFVGFDLASGAPFYDTNKLQPYGFAETQLSTQFRRLYIFFNGYIDINRDGKERRFIQLLEGLHWREAELLIAVKDRKLQELFPDIDQCLIRKVFPDILPALTEEDSILAAGIGGRNSDENNPNYKLYSKAEVEHLSKYRRIVFKDVDHAVAMGLEHLLPGYVAPLPYYDPELYLNFTVEKLVFGKSTNAEYHREYSKVSLEELGTLGSCGAKLLFEDLVKATEMGYAAYDFRNKVVPTTKPAKKKVAKKKVAKKVVPPVEVK